MTEGGLYIGDDAKLMVNINAEGFDQDTDNYTIDLYCGDSHISFTQEDVIIGSDGNHYLLVETSSLTPGKMRMVVRAQIPDTDFPDGHRQQTAVKNLTTIKELNI